MKKELTKKEVEQRVVVLKRFKELLQDQRKKFSEYLIVLETQERCIGDENIDAIVHHTELEQEIIGDIFTIQKVIDPIEKMYKFGSPEKEDDEVIRLKSDLDKLQACVLTQNKKNRELLQSRMTVLKQEIISMKPVYTFTSTAFREKEHSAAVIDISV
ncbi:hypothetical protein [Treponema pedis]|uniref:FlgN protein n=1 Tax=Treponema pedis str. T A4 TaxID=1291379 RepID=S6A877_9SPIR|nr:hypothetical protein [Treponema pedis]AGT43349.1 hypothetical protein TPE_0853 [Treponema pedis str. T A4]